jgi:DNA-binding transcriptional regulator YdaS (Cro superfamily)
MKLKDYFFRERIDPIAFAVSIDVSPTTIYRYMNGGRPHFKTAVKIEKETKGKVTVEDMRGKYEST